MNYKSAVGTTHGVAYVIAEDAGEAYDRLRADLDKQDLGYASDRAMDKIELLAEDCTYPDCGHKIYVRPKTF
jgi:hypothetical protein